MEKLTIRLIRRWKSLVVALTIVLLMSIVLNSLLNNIDVLDKFSRNKINIILTYNIKNSNFESF